MPSPEPAAPALLVRGVGKVFRAGESELVALEGIDLAVAEGEFVCLLGPSGCGKSTLLNAVAGFEPPSSGEILARGERVAGPGPDRAMVFQEYALFPWMTVARNVAFGLEQTRAPRERILARTEALLRQLGLWEFRDRYPKELSGGMRQRVAIARVLAIDPPTLLMDEPFGALDALTRRGLQDELLRIWAELGKTILFVTHGIEEALYLADRVVVMTYRPGRVKRVVPVELARPRDSTSPEFNALMREVSRLVLEEQARHEEDERAGRGDGRG
ncbi:MAG TPA: ABC transporter ATP-binding protein [Anaeromyxobacteraceae bacterium]|nr:ABC transporter ATP-binding protein [Anaeromyxobacteraceae bacterium]